MHAFPSYQVEDEEGRIRLMIHLSIEEEAENRGCIHPKLDDPEAAVAFIVGEES